MKYRTAPHRLPQRCTGCGTWRRFNDLIGFDFRRRRQWCVKCATALDDAGFAPKTWLPDQRRVIHSRAGVGL
jgi:hypothetical protein